MAVFLWAGLIQVGTNVVFDIYWRDWSVAAMEYLVALLKSCALAFGLLFVVDTPEIAVWLLAGVAGG